MPGTPRAENGPMEGSPRLRPGAALPGGQGQTTHRGSRIVAADEELIARAQAKKAWERRHPGWRAFYSGGQWHAHPRPVLSAGTLDGLDALVEQAHARPERWPALALVERTADAARRR